MLFILDRDEQVVAIFTNNGSPNSCPYYNDNFIEDIETGVSSYEFTIPSNHEQADLVQEDGYVVRSDLDGNLIMFNIMQIEEAHENISEKVIYAENAGLELLNDIFRPVTHLSKNAREILDLVLAGTRWGSGLVDYFGVNNFKFEQFDNIVAVLQSIKNQIGGELRFRVEMENGTVTKRFVDLVERIGTDTKKRFTYTKDITSIRRKIDTTSLVTALIGVGKGDDSGNYTTFASVGKYPENGDEYYKPYDQDWVGDPGALERYGKQGKHIMGIFEYDTSDPNILLDKTWSELQKRKNPSITYELDVALLERLAGIEHEKVRKGDTVYVIDETFSPALYLEARVLRLETCFTDPSKDKCTLGNYRIVKSKITSQMRAIQAKLLKKETVWDELTYTVYLDSSKGLIFKNGDINTTITARVFKGETEVTDTLLDSAFRWKMYDEQGNLDSVWSDTHNGVGNQVQVSSNDIQIKATFTCDVDLNQLKNI
ncbi:phage tail protein [Peribacillus asahii]|uniref:phage tail protein n=1 Tax=Peribacillus asahii TaxID=228899 RepID=UPI002079FF39|nr:phage tail protein [Peribacillus asahii]USK72608.1 phage tail protein [Peribacillus asahii]